MKPLGVFRVCDQGQRNEEVILMGRGILLWLLGIPIPILILLYLFNVI
ncbi:hypothetical protein BVIR_359 [Blastochloris viridis]|uniref:Uncharacterized protein n=1 Tax=Blastochloris viridis TaxID=1079 RepID=A0A0H5B8N7_BLAVI|nr:hypothetical protein BVIR_359 [Blastochloris viridis]BAR98577.1 hypothetical protein BV133_984 [Blastochloris viridis]CUU44079.1 hypothetical protein BVIRIDIS_31260 [Blastochloris viridis]